MAPSPVRLVFLDKPATNTKMPLALPGHLDVREQPGAASASCAPDGPDQSGFRAHCDGFGCER